MIRDIITKYFRKIKISKSLRLQIALLYILLAIINIIFFSVMIFENQLDLLISNFNFQSENLVKVILTDLENLKISEKDDEEYEELKATLLTNGVDEFVVIDENKNLIHQNNLKANSKILEFKDFDRKIKELKSRAKVIQSRYYIELNTTDFNVEFIIPLKTRNNLSLFLYTNVSIRTILDRLNLLYFQIALAVIWGVVFHLLFAIYLFKAIFKRMGVLQEASSQMAGGNLKARADWKIKNEDELDRLGIAFNMMASKVDETVSTLTRINDEIQIELEVGKQVQELFLPSKKVMKDYGAALYYRPMREVSGDIYHFYNIGSSGKAVFLADATGHGVSAALVTSVIMVKLDSIVKEVSNPRKVIEQLNIHLYNVLQSAFFATSVFFLFDGKGRMFFTNAGHNPPIYIRKKTKEILRIGSSGIGLGMDDHSEYEVKMLKTHPGDKILFYTDGAVEAENLQKEMFSQERIEKIILDNFDSPNAEICKILKTDLENHAPTFNDDVTLILLEIPSYES